MRTRFKRGIVFLLLTGFLIVLGQPSAYAGQLHQASDGTDPRSDWLSYVNYFRANANLPPIEEVTDWSDGATLHSRYVVANGLNHQEDPSLPEYTEAGAATGRNSNVFGGSGDWHFTQVLDTWMTGPFHQVAMLDPRLTRSGFGEYRDNGSYAATMDVLRGRDGDLAGVAFPVLFPADGKVMTLDRYDGNEWPDPLTSCAGYTAPSGPPLMLFLPADQSPQVTNFSFQHGDAALDACLFDATSYQHAEQAWQDLGRSLLQSRNAIVLMPRAPLQLDPPTTYTASVTTAGQTYTWSFNTAAEPGATDEPAITAPQDVTMNGTLLAMVGEAIDVTAMVDEATSTPVTYQWQADGQSAVERDSTSLQDTIQLRWDEPGVQTITVTVSNTEGSVSTNYQVRVVHPEDLRSVFLPMIQR
ncbi:MAG: CAP domain-containing protein [Chloroflexaceae bacterium]|nr:CAP domain-containing protein [Chloroflexaceae bacterium]